MKECTHNLAFPSHQTVGVAVLRRREGWRWGGGGFWRRVLAMCPSCILSFLFFLFAFLAYSVFALNPFISLFSRECFDFFLVRGTGIM